MLNTILLWKASIKLLMDEVTPVVLEECEHDMPEKSKPMIFFRLFRLCLDSNALKFSFKFSTGWFATFGKLLIEAPFEEI